MKKMSQIFGKKESMFSRRRLLEQRIWKAEESFTDYYQDKMVLAAGLSMTEEEIVEYIIEGVNDYSLANQARLQRFHTKEALRRINQAGGSSGRTTALRPRLCYVCSNPGHWQLLVRGVTIDCVSFARRRITCKQTVSRVILILLLVEES